MIALYIFILLMLLIAISIIAIPFFKSRGHFKIFLVFSSMIMLASLVLYQITGNSQALNQWLTQGQRHYELMRDYQKLGGIDGMIIRVKEKLKTNPHDLEGLSILNKLYRMKEKNTEKTRD